VPELPEIRAHAERLHAEFGGTPLAAFRPLSFTALKTVVPSPDVAVGQPLVSVHQRGKHLLLDFGTATFVVHLMQGGRLKPDPKQTKKPRGGVARWVFDDDRALLLTEAGTEKKAGVWVIDGDPESQPPLTGLGVEADRVDADALRTMLKGQSTRVHGFLRDQHGISGVGRRLANEICHRAKISPFTTTSKLTAEEVDRLVEAIGHAVDESLAYERGREDMSSSKQRPSNVHHRKGEACPVCGDTVRAVEYRAYEVDYCPTCQTGGKVLKDNTTSRFLK
jgi:formamidopyrimidine-DNA glycosylase